MTMVLRRFPFLGLHHSPTGWRPLWELPRLTRERTSSIPVQGCSATRSVISWSGETGAWASPATKVQCSQQTELQAKGKSKKWKCCSPTANQSNHLLEGMYKSKSLMLEIPLVAVNKSPKIDPPRELEQSLLKSAVAARQSEGPAIALEKCWGHKAGRRRQR